MIQKMPSKEKKVADNSEINAEDDIFDTTWDNLSSRRRCESKHRLHKVIRFRILNKK